MTQHELILRHIDRYGSISPMEAFSEYGITKLATRISEMRRRGINFTKIMVEQENRFGEPVRYMRYWRAAQ